MPETLTESFCERCGTRYTFESAAPRVRRIGQIRTLSKGLRNFVMSDSTSLDEALAAARGETDREAVSQQLDAFHKALHFCMSCRQYTCSNCWNNGEGRCLTCAPQLGHEALAIPLPQVALDGADGNGALPADGEWPTTELRPVDAPDGLDAWPDAPETAGWAEAELDSDEIAQRLAALGVGPVGAAADDEPAADREPVEAEAEPEAAVAEAAPGAVDEPEPEPARAQAEPELVAAEAEPEPVAAKPEIEPEAVPAGLDEPEAVAAQAEPEVVVAGAEPEVVLARAEPEPLDVAPIADAEAVAARADAEALVAEAEAIWAEPGQLAIEPEPVEAGAEPEAVAAQAEPDSAGARTGDASAGLARRWRRGTDC